MLNLFVCPSKISSEFVFLEIEPHFNYIIRNTRTPSFILAEYKELFYYENLVVPWNSNLRKVKKDISDKNNINAKDINVIKLSRDLISPIFKHYINKFEIKQKRHVVIEPNSSFMKQLPNLLEASHILTHQESFAKFAVLYKIPCTLIINEKDNYSLSYFKAFDFIELVTM